MTAADLACAVCKEMGEVCREIIQGAGAALLTEEAITADRDGRLIATLKSQPAWSDFPLVMLARDGAAEAAPLREVRNATLVERPVKVRSLVSVVRAALRARQRQYEVRDHLLERERQSAVLRENEERLRFALGAGRLGSWDLDMTTGEMTCTVQCKANYGRAFDAPFGYAELFDAVHPDERARLTAAVEAAVAQRADLDIEYRCLWPDGTVHWVMVRGRASYTEDGRPVRLTGVSLDVTDRRRGEESLRDADRKKDDFIALLAHELRAIHVGPDS